MATTDELQSFLENVLRSYSPTIDLSPGSPAQTRIIGPILTRIALDPLDTDIPLFIRERFIQEFPDLAADGGGALEDILAKPFQLLLEAFKRTINEVRLNQTVNNATLMADAEADALGANWFERREDGGRATTIVRVFFAAPTTSSITTEKRCFTDSGLSYFPIQNYLITSTQMLFNRQGTLYYQDIVVQAELPGTDYNVVAGSITGIDNVPGVVKVTNLNDIVDGVPREDNTTYLGRVEQVLTERSLVTPRGVTAQVPKLFSDVRALQVIGAGEVGMDRDILEGSSEGFLHQTGSGLSYGDWLFISAFLVDAGPHLDIIIQEGDLIRFQPSTGGTIYSANISSILVFTPQAPGSPYKAVVLLDKTLIPGMSAAVIGTYALFKPGFLTISKVPGGMLTTTVPDGTVHLGGHTDVLVRPNTDVKQAVTLPNIVDDSPLRALLSLSIGATPPNDNLVATGALDLIGVGIGDFLVIETGVAAGSYRILNVGSPDAPTSLRVDAQFTLPEAGLRARIISSVHVDLAEPKRPKLPFDTGSVSDLRMTVGSVLFRFDSLNIASYGAVIGDILRVLDGPNAGDYIIKSFDQILGGQGAIVDRAAGASDAGVRYEVFTPSTGLLLPLVRLRSLELLDATNQGTGISIPYGDAVDVRPTCNFEGAGKEIRTLDKEVLIFPDTSGIWPISSDAPSFGSDIDARYSQELVSADGFTKFLLQGSGGPNPIHSVEINFPPFLWSGRKDKLLAFANKKDVNFTADPSGSHRTSDIAEAKVGDSIVMLDGPNQGKYLIKDLRVLDLWNNDGITNGHIKTALVQVEPEFKVDPIRTAMNFIVTDGSQTPIASADLLKIVQYASNFFDAAGFYLPFLTTLEAALSNAGFTIASLLLRQLLDNLAFSGYTIGPSAKGVLRSYFLDPVSVEFRLGINPTLFQDSGASSIVFRPDLNLLPAQILPESGGATTPDQWFRDASVRYPEDQDLFRTPGSPFAKSGVESGDIFEFYPAVNDLPARGTMASSWMCITQEGSNVARLILPQHPDNRTTPIAGQLLFIDSGPDVGAYTITSVQSANFGASPPVITVTLDRVLTHSTMPFPPTPFQPGPAQVQTLGNSFPLGGLPGAVLAIEFSLDGGVTIIQRDHTFGAGPFNSAADVVSDILTDGVFVGSELITFSGSSEVFLQTIGSTVNTLLHIRDTSTCIAVGLKFLIDDIGRGDSLFYVDSTSKVYHPSFTTVNIGDWITVYSAQSPSTLSDGDDTFALGTFKVLDKGIEVSGVYMGMAFLTLDRASPIPAPFPINPLGLIGHFLIHSAPATTPPDTSLGGRQISDQFVRFRMYDSVPQQRTISIPWTTASINPIDPNSEEQIELSAPLIASINYGHRDPYRILRVGVRRVSSTAMALQREGALYYVDIPVVGYGSGPEMNIPEGESLFIAGSIKIDGYVLVVKDPVFSFSLLEKVSILLPKAVLPVGSFPNLDSLVNLSGQNVQILYDTAPLVQEIQNFVDSPLDRVTSASLLVRHFLPSYVFVDMSYSGGSDESVVATDLINLINNIPPNNNQLRADAFQDIAKNRGAFSVTLPITMVSLTHGVDRRIRGLRSQNAIGEGTLLPPFNGTYKQMYFIAGPDTSLQIPRPGGEQIFLRRN